MDRYGVVTWVYGHTPFTGLHPYCAGLYQAQNDLWRDGLGLTRYDPGTNRDSDDYRAGYEEGLRRGAGCPIMPEQQFIAKKIVRGIDVN